MSINKNILMDVGTIKNRFMDAENEMIREKREMKLMALSLDTVSKIRVYLDFAIKYIESEGVDDGK